MALGETCKCLALSMAPLHPGHEITSRPLLLRALMAAAGANRRGLQVPAPAAPRAVLSQQHRPGHRLQELQAFGRLRLSASSLRPNLPQHRARCPKAQQRRSPWYAPPHLCLLHFFPWYVLPHMLLAPLLPWYAPSPTCYLCLLPRSSAVPFLQSVSDEQPVPALVPLLLPLCLCPSEYACVLVPVSPMPVPM